MTRPRNTFSLLRYLFPHTRQRARARLFVFRHETLPYYRLRAQSRIYRFIVRRQAIRREKIATGKGILWRLGGRRGTNRTFGAKDARTTYTSTLSRGYIAEMDSESGYTSASERGTRRRKLAGYLRAANELRQSYQQAYGLGGRDGSADEDESAIPGSFPDVSVVRSDDEEMLLFPSYARRHHKKKGSKHERPGTDQDLRTADVPGDAEYWQKEWEKYEDDNAIVDVDIRGWIYAPQRGQMTRKNRIMVGIARHLSGIPAPSSSRASSPSSPHHARVEARAARNEEKLAADEAKSIEVRGEGEADVAWQGGYSETPSKEDRCDLNALNRSYTSSPNERSRTSPISWTASSTTLNGLQYDSTIKPIEKRKTWNQPSEMSSEELSVANAHLMVRLKPFLTTPLVSTPLTVFFYDDNASISRTITTNEAGHFSLRAALDFIPSHVRVLASDKLSATEEVQITEPKGVSVISDIDDTIKHSAIGSGAKEIFRNAFIRDLADLTIDGVKEWYQTLADMGVQLHYVSNSPWQLYPVLTSFFARAGLPKGSFHLKQYTGMLQGIFEPVAERKKGTLEKIMTDFPERRFILVGDTGEADLELYTDIMLADPSRILGVYIRDVTTRSTSRGFFNSTHGSRGSRSPTQSSESASRSSSFKSSAALNEKPPALPPRPSTRSSSSLAPKAMPCDSNLGTLLDLDEDSSNERLHQSRSDPSTREPDRKASIASFKSLPPNRPSKPLTLRPAPTPPPLLANPTLRKPIPPAPPKPRRYVSSTDSPSSDPSPLSQIQNVSPALDPNIITSNRPHTYLRPPPPESPSYRSAVKSKVSSAYNALPPWSTSTPPPSQPPPPNTYSNSTSARQPPPVPPRRNLASYPAAAAHYATNHLSGGWAGANAGAASFSSTFSPSANSSNDGVNEEEDEGDAALSKKEELWIRRWERAQQIFREHGVVLKSWRIGEDVADGCVRVVDEALREDRRPKNSNG